MSSSRGRMGFHAGTPLGAGFLLDSPSFLPALGETSVGNDGAGGQFAFGDEESGAGFAYVANRMIDHGDARANNLIKALRKSH
ncbi:hypothetical protein AB0H34_36430 [Saccharopolyspora shandongensis]|uniref:hypothetical protein n=1 Tax=Saccharopolyspora shandongensis TaxID=418495 RepID=UPI0033EBC244